MDNNAKMMPLQVIKAAAGSGKTYQLTYEYIKLLLGKKNQADGSFSLAKNRSEYHEHILAVTFTNKATDEMKQRIVKELHLMMHGEGDFVDKMVEEFKTTRQQLCDAAGTALQELLFGYTSFNVCTIDSFFQTVLRAFAYELDQDYDYAVAIDEKYAINMAVNNLLTEVSINDGSKKLLHRWLADMMHYKLTIEKKRWDFFRTNELLDIAENIDKEFFQNKKNEVVAYLDDVVKGLVKPRVQQFRDEILSLFNECSKPIPGFEARFNEVLLNADVPRELLYSKSGLSFLVKWFAGEALKKKDVDAFLAKTANEIVAWKKKDKEWTARAKNGSYDRQFNEMQDLVKEAFEVEAKRNLYGEILSKVYVFGLLGLINIELEEFLRSNNTVLLSNTNQMLGDVMLDGNVLFMYERIGTWINHFLIDEFQDTSNMQYRNMLPLLADSVSVGNENLIIGDEKQCIYRFRSSDPMLLQQQVDKDFSGSVFIDRSKLVNWRSTVNVINFNNTLFSLIVDKLQANDTYSSLLQTVGSKKQCNSGAVSVNLLPSKIVVNVGEESVEMAPDKYVLHQLPGLIKDLMGRGYRMQDIAILVDRNKEGAEVISQLLEYNRTVSPEECIDVVSAESMYLSKSPAVRLVISYLRYFDSVNLTESTNEGVRRAREREERAKRVLRHFEILASKRKEADAEKMGEMLKQAFVNDAEQEAQFNAEKGSGSGYSQEYLSVFNQLISDPSELFDLVTIVESVICHVVPEENRRTEKAFLMSLMDYVIDFSEGNNATVHNFLRWWDSQTSLSVMSPGGKDAVTVMTVHKSKGLEFPCVIIPFADWKMCKVTEVWFFKEDMQKSAAFNDILENVIPPILPISNATARNIDGLAQRCNREEQESIIDILNKTYVAFTRAVNEMHIFAKNTPPADDNYNATLASLLTELCGKMNEPYAQELNAQFAQSTGVDTAIATAVTCRIEENDIVHYEVGDLGQKYVAKASPEAEPMSQTSGDAPADDDSALPKAVPNFTSSQRKVAVVVPESGTAMQENGIRMHRLFSQLKCRSHKDRVLRTARRRGLIRDNYEHVEALVEHVLAHPVTSQWFDDKNRVLNERTILNGAGMGDTRPDRIIITPEGKVLVIDYKFGSDHSHDSKYCKQVLGYMSDLGNCGINVDEGYVWYPEEDIIINVTDKAKGQ
ncbi:MAG: UvrD-helicase domain-containing protein [Muribaculaceae bacterium]